MAAKTELQKKLGVQSPAETVQHLNILIYGDPGVGKTYLAATAQDHPDTKPILFVDVEGGTTTIRERKDVDVKRIRSLEEIVKLHNDIHQDDTNYYKTIIVDSLTELQDLDMKTIMDEEYNAKPDSVDKDVPTQRAWGKSRNHIRKIVRAYRDLPCNTIFTALAHYNIDETTNVKEIYPSLPGKLRGEIPGFLDIVGYLYTVMEKDELIRRVQFAKTRRIIAKDRTGVLGDFMDSPSIPLMWEQINGG